MRCLCLQFFLFFEIQPRHVAAVPRAERLSVQVGLGAHVFLPVRGPVACGARLPGVGLWVSRGVRCGVNVRSTRLHLDSWRVGIIIFLGKM